jgi:transposase
MADGMVSMSGGERERAYVVRLCLEGRLSQREASERLGIGVRQVKRLVRAWRRDGDAGLVSRQRGRPSHRRMGDALRARIVNLLTAFYPDFGPTLASEKLAERDGIAVSAETVRRIQIECGLWRPKRRREKRVFPLRPPRPRLGELLQIDGSPHDWFEGRAPRCTLIVFIDDATKRLTALRFVPAESTKAYLETLREQVLAHGLPLALYSDRHGVFHVNAKDAESGDGKTEFGRAVERLGIELIPALTPQAKGRVERANQTMQDRLVKEMRLRNISSMEAGQAFLAAFMRFWNERFAIEPRDPRSAYRPWTKTESDLDLALASREERTLSKALTFGFGGTKYCVNVRGPGTAMRGGKVLVHRLVDGRLHVTYKDRVLALTAYGSYPVPDPGADEKTLDVRVDALVAAAKTAPSMVSLGAGGVKPGARRRPASRQGA